VENDNIPHDPITQMAEGAAQMHEAFTAWIEAGFTRAEALQITIAVLQAGIRQQ
jgi:hypothetical protein